MVGRMKQPAKPESSIAEHPLSSRASGYVVDAEVISHEDVLLNFSRSAVARDLKITSLAARPVDSRKSRTSHPKGALHAEMVGPSQVQDEIERILTTIAAEMACELEADSCRPLWGMLECRVSGVGLPAWTQFLACGSSNRAVITAAEFHHPAAWLETRDQARPWWATIEFGLLSEDHAHAVWFPLVDLRSPQLKITSWPDVTAPPTVTLLQDQHILRRDPSYPIGWDRTVFERNIKVEGEKLIALTPAQEERSRHLQGEANV